MELTISEFSKTCPVKVGDRFYRKNTKLSIPDRLEVTKIIEIDGSFFIEAKYMYRKIGENLTRTFSDIIFKSDDWVIERKGIDFK